MARHAKSEATLQAAYTIAQEIHEQNESEVAVARTEMRAKMREPDWVAGVLGQ